MVTLIAVYNSEGCVGRCDARCYGAHEPDCDCICQGRNHGAGLTRAVENTQQLAEQWLDKARAEGCDFTSHELGQATAPALFDMATTRAGVP